jgi:hypothetical protein
MNNLLIITLLLNNFAWMFVYLYSKNKDIESERGRFREYVIASKAATINQYVEAIPEENEQEEELQDEMLELSEVEPEKLLKVIRSQKHESD